MNTYTEKEIRTLEWNEHIRKRPGMYIGKLGDGSSPDDGIYVLLKEVMDNSVDEYAMGHGKSIIISIKERSVTVRDHGRGIPLGSLVDVASRMNTGAKYDSKAFKKSVGLNGVGIKAVNALSSSFYIQSFRDGESQFAKFSKGELLEEERVLSTEKNGTLVTFVADEELFGNYVFNMEFIESMLRNYSYLNTGLSIRLNGQEFISKNGLLDLLNESLVKEPLYPPIHLKGDDIEIAITHGNDYGEGISSFVNGQFTTQGGTHLSAFREAVAKTIKDFFKKDFDPSDVRQSMIAAVSIKVQEPVFESQTKTKLGSKEVSPGGASIRNFIGEFIKEHLDNYLHRHPEIADAMQKKILDSEKERKAISGIQKLARERAKKASLHNKNLRDCRIHYTDKDERSVESTLFITEGDSASGSITKSRNVLSQAVFSLRGKPKNSYGLTKKIVYENEEFNLLQAALNIEEDLENLRYNQIVIATDADVDGMHIRLLLLTFFLQFFPDLIRQGHLYILQTPLFRVRNKKETIYCYSLEERDNALKKLGTNPEITRFKGLGEISPDEFRYFIGENIRLEKVRLGNDDNIPELLEFYMGKNTIDRQNFIRSNLRSNLVVEEAI
ncbi:MAG: type IIA DNA topoisomerase subunit B [Bacteroidia bacterium]|nr:DNA topoisomerase IV subunit B [Rikenellaceae bacterium]NCB17995.1 type IIA DNA topoisomerase subunit B [Bacteroidia bacterium]